MRVLSIPKESISLHPIGEHPAQEIPRAYNPNRKIAPSNYGWHSF